MVPTAVDAASRSAGVLPPSIAVRWDSDGTGPSEEQVRDRAGAGNAYLEPVFFSLFSAHGPEPDPGLPDARCYYFPVQPGRYFDAGRVTAVMRFCYADRSQRPYRVSTTSLLG